MWLGPPDKLILSTGEPHVWRADLELDNSAEHSFAALLSDDEIIRAQKFRFAADKRNFIIARGILRSLIGRYLEADPAKICFHYTKFGKPLIPENDTFRFNISHSQNTALFAFANNLDIGVDIEFVNPAIEVKDIAANFFSVNEVRSLFALPEEQQVAGFFNCWTRKEAFIKAVGEGLSFPLDKFEVSLEPGKPAELLATHWEPKDVSKWSMYSISPGPNFVGSLVAKGAVDQIKLLNWPTN